MITKQLLSVWRICVSAKAPVRSGLLLASFMLVATANVQAAMTRAVQIYFDGACPKSVVPELVDISKAEGDKIEWSAYDQTSGTKLNIDFEIFFDPFKGKSMASNNKGEVTSNKVENDVPVNVEFKYTIYSPTCPQAPLDPRIMIR